MQGISYGSGADGSVGHLSSELFKRATGISALHVPYKGTGAALPDLIGGRVDYYFATQVEVVSHVAAGRLRALALTARQRSPNFPDVPTMIELGFQGFDPTVFYGFMVPVNTSAPIIRQLQGAVVKAITAPEVQERLNTLGLTPNLGGSDELAATLKSEIARWAQVIKAANIHAE